MSNTSPQISATAAGGADRISRNCVGVALQSTIAAASRSILPAPLHRIAAAAVLVPHRALAISWIASYVRRAGYFRLTIRPHTLAVSAGGATAKRSIIFCIAGER